MAAHQIGAIPAYANLAEFQPRCGSGKACFPINGSYHKVSTIAPCLLDNSGFLPIPSHVICICRRRSRGSGVHLFGAEETQSFFSKNPDLSVVEEEEANVK